MHWITSFLGVFIISGTHPARLRKPPKPIGDRCVNFNVYRNSAELNTFEILHQKCKLRKLFDVRKRRHGLHGFRG